MPIATLDQVAARGSQTALMLAAYSGQFRVATALLEAGADVDARHEGSFGQDKTARQSHSMNLKSKWRNISNPDVFCAQQLWCRGSQPKHVSNPAYSKEIVTPLN